MTIQGSMHFSTPKVLRIRWITAGFFTTREREKWHDEPACGHTHFTNTIRLVV
jgi:hypothetical protein